MVKKRKERFEDNPEDYNPNENEEYVPDMNIERKKRIEQQHKDLAVKHTNVETTGMITIIMFKVWDLLIEILFKFGNELMTIAYFSFEWMYILMFGAFEGLIPGNEKTGVMYTWKFLRLFLTVILPPVGVVCGKGLYGWFNIAICMTICYVNYMAGIIYALIITSRNRYADRYEKKEIARIKELQGEKQLEEHAEDKYALIGMLGFLAVVGTSIFCFFYFL